MFTAACSTYSKKECASFDWSHRGYLAALDGKHEEVGLAHYHKECRNEYDIHLDEEQFKLGYKKGLKVFCTPEYGERHGSRGGDYQGICSEENEKGFLKPYVKGINEFYKRRVTDLEAEVGNLRSKISSLESEKSSLESQLNSCRSGH